MPVNAPEAVNQVSARPPDALGGSVIACNQTDDIYAKLQTVQDGDTLLVEGGAVWNTNSFPPTDGNRTLEFPVRGTGWKAIRPTTESNLPAVGTRLVPATHAAFLPKIQIGSRTGCVITRPGVHGWRITGLEISAASNYDTFSDHFNPIYVYCILGQGSGGSGEHVGGEDIGHLFWMDRCYIHGYDSLTRTMRGLAVRGKDIRVSDTVIDDIQQANAGVGDCQGVWIHENGQGPALLENCYVSGSGQSVMVGSPEGMTVAQRAAHVTLLRNTIEQKRRWGWLWPTAESDGIEWVTKSAVEIKWGHHVYAEGNTTQGVSWWPTWTMDTMGSDVTIVNNYDIAQSSGFFQLWDTRGLQGAGADPTLYPGCQRIKVYNNLSLGIKCQFNSVGAERGPISSGSGQAFQMLLSDLTADFWAEHNTIVCRRGTTNFQGSGIARSRFKNNILGYGNGGFMTEGDWQHTDAAFDGRAITDREWAANALIFFGNEAFGNSGAGYGQFFLDIPPTGADFTQATWAPPNNAVGQFYIVGALPKESSIATAGITVATGVLATDSPLKAGGAYQASDSTDNGVNFAALAAGMARAPVFGFDVKDRI